MKTLKGLLWMALVLAACKPTKLQPTLTPVDTVTPPPTITPFIFPATWTPVPTAVPMPVLRPREILDFEAFSSDREHHHLILFTSLVNFPLNGLTIGGYTTKGDPVNFTETQLWALSPDGQMAGRLTPDGLSTGFYQPSDPSAKSLVTQYVIAINNDRVQDVKLPGECYGQLAKGEEWAKNLLEPCGNFKFSSDGRYLAFNFGPEVCGRGIAVINTQTSELLYRSPMGGGHSFEFLANNKLLLMSGHCEGGSAGVFDPSTKAMIGLGTEGGSVWNLEHSAVAVSTSPYLGIAGSIWGYNVLSDSLFLSQLPFQQFDDHLLWSPDGTHLLYQHRPITRTQSGYTFDGARQIISVDGATGENQVLAGDPAYDFDLCGAAYSWCDHWYGDWVQVRQFPFQPESVKETDDIYYNPIVKCRLYGIECADTPEYFALNWRTGELIPWEQAPLPTVAPTPKPTATPVPGPNPNSTPIYAGPSGAYAFYVGQDGHSLWMVPARGKPQLWVTEGENFVYIP